MADLSRRVIRAFQFPALYLHYNGGSLMHFYGYPNPDSSEFNSQLHVRSADERVELVRDLLYALYRMWPDGSVTVLVNPDTGGIVEVASPRRPEGRHAPG